jgi:toxin ParE1/3/4
VKVRLLKKAEADLDEIWDFIAQDNPPAATETIENILRGLKTLATFQTAGRERNELQPGLRSWPTIHPYIVFYIMGAEIRPNSSRRKVR